MNGISEFYIFYNLFSALEFCAMFGILLGLIARIFLPVIK